MRMATHVRSAVLVAMAATSSMLAQTQNLVVSAGFNDAYYALPAVASGEILTLFTTALNVPDVVATQIPLPNSLSGVSVLAHVIGAADTTGYPTSLPILRVYTQNALQMPDGVFCPTNPNSVLCSQTQITVEIPTEGVCVQIPGRPPVSCLTLPFSDLPPLLVLNVKANGVTGPDLPVRVEVVAAHFLSSCDLTFGPSVGYCGPLVTHADGTLVNKSSPARVGEIITLYAVGLGFPGPGYAPPTGYAPSKPVQLPADYGTVVFDYLVAPTTLSPNAEILTTPKTTVQADWVGLIPGYVGLNQINVKVPPMPAQPYPCSAGWNTQLSPLQFTATAGTLKICVQP